MKESGATNPEIEDELSLYETKVGNHKVGVTPYILTLDGEPIIMISPLAPERFNTKRLQGLFKILRKEVSSGKLKNLERTDLYALYPDLVSYYQEEGFKNTPKTLRRALQKKINAHSTCKK